MKKTFAIVVAALLMTLTAGAQEKEFYPGWYLGLQGGVNYTTSNNWNLPHFQHLNAPNLSLDLGYDFTPVFGLRGSLSGPVANFPAPTNGKQINKFNYGQLGLDATFDILNIFRQRADRGVSPYIFAGGAGYARFKGANADKGLGLGVRAGAGINFRLGDLVTLSVEVVDNALNNKFNTLEDNTKALGGTPLEFKKPFPWDANLGALVGLKFNIGANNKRKAAAASIAEAAAAAEAARIAAEQEAARREAARLAAEKAEQDRIAAERAAAERAAAERAAAERAAAERAAAAARAADENILFLIGQTNIRKSETPKIDHIVSVLKQYPEATVTVSGYADRETGNPSNNMSLSKGRAERVAKALQDAGIAASRIKVEYFGDTQRVSNVPEENRVAVCVTR